MFSLLSNGMKSTLEYGKPKGLRTKQYIRNGVKLTNHLEWWSAVGFCELEAHINSMFQLEERLVTP